jgi:toxin-antitoxin system PIN domain toxin
MRALLDVNVWISLIDPAHPHHRLAQDWFGAYNKGFASCPIIQNGVLRIMASPSYDSGDDGQYSYPMLFDLFKTSISKVNHSFWPDSISLLSASHFNHDMIMSDKQLTDIYLLGLAVAHGGCLVTFDRHIALSHVVGASKEHLIVLR